MIEYVRDDNSNLNLNMKHTQSSSKGPSTSKIDSDLAAECRKLKASYSSQKRGNQSRIPKAYGDKENGSTSTLDISNLSMQYKRAKVASGESTI